MLLGHYVAKLDDKGRVSVPARFREELKNDLVVSRWFEKCLILISKKLWNSMVSRISGGDLATLSARDVDRFLFAGSFEIVLDSQGRFVIPVTLREYAKIKEDVVCAGLGDKIEIWSKSLWDKKERAIILEAGDKVEALYRERKSGERHVEK